VNTLVYGANTGWSVTGSLSGVTKFTFNYNYTFAYATWGQVTLGNNVTIDKLTWTNAQNSGVDDITIVPAGGSGARVASAEGTHIQSEGKETSFEVYPNPVKDVLHISFPDTGTQMITGEIRGAQSALYKNFSMEGLRAENGIDVYVGNLENGVYFLVVQQGRRRETRKVVVAR
jgi:hypothetical protein